jgi:hypothetical protein
VRELHHAHAERLASFPPEDMSMAAVYTLTKAGLRANIAYRGVLISYAELVAASKDLQAFTARMDEGRPERMRAVLSTLIENGHVDPTLIAGQDECLRLQLEALGRFWLPAAILAGRRRSLKKAADERARLMLHAWRPYTTSLGRHQIDEILQTDGQPTF